MSVPWKTPYGVNATTPLVINEMIFITSGYGTGAQLLQVSDTEANVMWTNKVMAAHHSDGFVQNGFLYGYSGQSMQNKGFFKINESTRVRLRQTTASICLHE